MRTQGILGSVLLVIGVALLIIGINASQSPLEQAAQTLLGRYTNGTVWYLVAGLGTGVAGLVMLLTDLRGRSA